MKELIPQMKKLLTVKSIVTLTLTMVFCALAAGGRVENQKFIELYSMIIVFYFGAQYGERKPKPTE